MRRERDKLPIPAATWTARAQFRAPLWALRVSSTSTGADVRPRSARGQPLSANGARNGLTFPITLQSARSSDHRDQRHDKCRKLFTQSISRSADNVLRRAVRTEMLDPVQGPSDLGGSTSTRSTRHPGQAAQSRDLMRTQPCIRSRIASTRLGFRVMLEACLRHDGWIFDSA